MPRVNPDILRWARETAGLSLPEAATRINLGAARGVEPADRLEALESGHGDPSRALLVRMAKQYRRPLVVFYLDEPPPTADRGQDFRTTGDRAPAEEAPLLDALIRDVIARHGLIRAALEADDDVERVEFVGTCSMDQGTNGVAEVMAHTLGFNREAFRREHTVTDAFALLRSWVEASGVFVLLIGDLGSPRHNAISERTFRGYALADEVAPIVVVNDQDARAAWSFTLLHEFCHILLGATGVSDVYGGTAVERFCNEVAGLMLLAEGELGPLSAAVAGLTATEAAEPITQFAALRKVSRTMVAYRLQRRGMISAEVYAALDAAFYQEWRDQRERRRERAREEDRSGPSYYTVRRHRLGPALLETVSYLYSKGALTTRGAGKVLGVKPKNVPQLLGEAPLGAGV